jgi:hypothetical protein
MTPIYFGEEPIKHLYSGSNPTTPIETIRKGTQEIIVTTTTGPYSENIPNEFDLFPEE